MRPTRMTSEAVVSAVWWRALTQPCSWSSTAVFNNQRPNHHYLSFVLKLHLHGCNMDEESASDFENSKIALVFKSAFDYFSPPFRSFRGSLLFDERRLSPQHNLFFFFETYRAFLTRVFLRNDMFFIPQFVPSVSQFGWCHNCRSVWPDMFKQLALFCSPSHAFVFSPPVFFVLLSGLVLLSVSCFFFYSPSLSEWFSPFQCFVFNPLLLPSFSSFRGFWTPLQSFSLEQTITALTITSHELGIRLRP